MASNHSSGIFLALHHRFIFPIPLLISSGYISKSAPHAVLLVVFVHPSTSFAAVTFQMLHQFACPSHTSANSSVGSITFIRIQFAQPLLVTTNIAGYSMSQDIQCCRTHSFTSWDLICRSFPLLAGNKSANKRRKYVD